ncbi:hypothetical protein MJG53_002437 [Ovis ammon polii x Ovis aries]|uniref:Nucleolar protein 10 n=2 Tax=Ovis TaxID=9935 RepID=A0A836AP36_SHEEP|nr:hypothetical protein JEQ12_010092 [Ovis aries]KAI4588029.1 hypothetical protein MJG53_002437 [Ovis ammon polii x Ovis aries]
MFLQYYYSGQGDQSRWAYPVQFALDDKYSQDEITIKKCFKVLMTQKPRPVL